MRQAGRYLPEYRVLRSRAASFLDLCFDPKLASEITLQPVERFDLDAAILFSDILVVPFALGRNVDFVKGEGPKLEPLTAAGIARLNDAKAIERLEPVLATIREVRKKLSLDKTLIGFCGAPWTVATYMIAGSAAQDQLPARQFAAEHPNVFARLIDVLVDISADYLVAQLENGADVVQIFDSWAGILGEVEFERWSIEPTARMVSRVREQVPDAKIVGFPRGAGLRFGDYARATKVHGISIDWTVPLSYARDNLQPVVAVQGNLDPVTLRTGGAALNEAVDRTIATLGQRPFIFNLGHGVLPDTPPDHVEQLVKRVRGVQ
jgi:uroporphyrinogen decarboxylase